MEFTEFRTLWEELTSIKGKKKYAKRAAEIKELIKDVPVDKLFCVDVRVLSDYVDSFFIREYDLNPQFTISDSAFAGIKNQILVLYLKNSRYEITKQFVLGRIFEDKYDLRALISPNIQHLYDTKALMAYDGLEDALWDAIKANYNWDRQKQIGLISRRIKNANKQIAELRNPNYVEDTTAKLTAQIDDAQKALEELQSKLDTI